MKASDIRERLATLRCVAVTRIEEDARHQMAVLQILHDRETARLWELVRECVAA